MNAADFFNNVARFWSKVDTSGDCWIWTSERNGHGYGRFEFWDAGSRTRVLAHRMALKLTGHAVSDEAVVLHACDTPACVRPDHLRLGTQSDNMRDAKAKGRLNLGGLSAHVDFTCRTCSQTFSGRPSRRYCDDHQPTASQRAKEWRARRKDAA